MEAMLRMAQTEKIIQNLAPRQPNLSLLISSDTVDVMISFEIT